MFQYIAVGHPKFGAEREVRASPWGFALIASRLDALRIPKKRLDALRVPKKRPERTQAVGLKEWWAGLPLAERTSEFTAAGRRAGLPDERHPKLKLAEPTAVPNPSSFPTEV